MSDTRNCARESPARKCGNAEFDPGSRYDAAHIFLGNGDYHTQMRNLLNDKQRGIGATGTDECARMHEAVSDHAIKGRGDLQIRHHGLERVHRRLGSRAGFLARVHQSLSRVHLFLGEDQIVARHGPGRLCGLLHALVRALGGGQLRFGLKAVRLRGLEPGLGLADLRLHFRSRQIHQEFSRPHDASAVDQHAIDIARHLGVQGDGEVRPDLGGQLDGPRNGLGNDRSQIARLRPANLGEQSEYTNWEKKSPIALHSIGSRDPKD